MDFSNVHQGIAAKFDRTNVDTDQIIPKQFLKKTSKSGYGKHLFNDWRYLEDGSDNIDFELNKPAFKGATILVAGDNFGCGSSREHAAWSIGDYGFQVIISTSFADIFFNNCFKNGILPISVTAEALSSLMDEIEENEGVQFSVDLENQKITTPNQIEIDFDIDPFRKENLLKGLDEISWTLQYTDQIKKFEENQIKREPWLW